MFCPMNGCTEERRKREKDTNHRTTRERERERERGRKRGWVYRSRWLELKELLPTTAHWGNCRKYLPRSREHLNQSRLNERIEK